MKKEAETRGMCYLDGGPYDGAMMSFEDYTTATPIFRANKYYGKYKRTGNRVMTWISMDEASSFSGIVGL